MIKKIVTLEVDGKTVGFRFNMLSFGKACEIEGCSIDQLFERLGSNGGNVNLITLNNFFFASAINYFEGEKREIDFTAQDVSDWLSYLGLEKCMDMVNIAMKTPDIKN